MFHFQICKLDLIKLFKEIKIYILKQKMIKKNKENHV